jgi:hypothetical protein
MKTLSRTFAFIFLAIVAIVALVSCISKFATNYKYDQPIGDPTHYRTFKKGDDNDSDFRAKLINPLLRKGGACEITFLHTGPHHTPEPHHYHDICPHGGSVNLKTDRVIKSKTANNRGGQPAANDPNVTWHIMSNYQGDIDAVMNTLNP